MNKDKQAVQKLSRMLVTPRIAQDMIATQKVNRKILEAHVSALAAAMKRGEWIPFASTLFFDADGHLVDGQHRLMAVIRSEMPQHFVVERGVEADIVSVLDTGKTRSFNNTLAMVGEKNVATLAGIVKRVFAWENAPHAWWRSDQEMRRACGWPSTKVLLDFFYDNSEELRDAAHFSNSRRIRYYSTVVMGSVYVVAGRWDKESITNFFDALYTGEDLQKDQPVYRLRHLIERQSPGKAYRPDMLAALTIKAWNKTFLGGENGTRAGNLSFRPLLEEFPEIYLG